MNPTSLSPVPREVNILAACEAGFWQCKRCYHIGEPERIEDPQDVAPPQNVCMKCGYHFVKWHAPVLPA